MSVLTKILTWIGANWATVLGALQTIIKGIKEILTGVVNLLSLVMSKELADKSVSTVRGICNTVDGWIEAVKEKLLGY